jgi:hypothetical protein
MMFPPRDPTRRRFLAAAVASAAGAGTLAAAAAMNQSVPQAVTTPRQSGPDPLHDVIEAHRKAAREHTEAIDLEAAFEEAHAIKGEEYDRLCAVTMAAYYAMADVGRHLVNTRPTTLAGILALCKYIEPLFAEVDQPELPEYIDFDDDTQAYIPEAFAYVIGRAVEELIKAGQT